MYINPINFEFINDYSSTINDYASMTIAVFMLSFYNSYASDNVIKLVTILTIDFIIAITIIRHLQVIDSESKPVLEADSELETVSEAKLDDVISRLYEYVPVSDSELEPVLGPNLDDAISRSYEYVPVPISTEIISTTETHQKTKLTYSCGGTRIKTVMLENGFELPGLLWSDTSFERCIECGYYPNDKRSTCRTSIVNKDIIDEIMYENHMDKIVPDEDQEYEFTNNINLFGNNLDNLMFANIIR